MARKSKLPVSEPPPPPMTVQQMQFGIKILQRRIEEIEKIEPMTANREDIRALETSIEESLTRVFGKNSDDWRNYISASNIDQTPLTISGPFSSGRIHPGPHIERGRNSALATLKGAVKTLEERIADAEDDFGKPEPFEAVEPTVSSTDVFMVHGHDGELKQEVARFLEHLGLSPIILHEKPNGGKTIIEKFEKESDVGFAIVLLTPDDVGGANGQQQHPRARQNVIMELGYFIGKLGRERVCVLKRGDIEPPSDILGVVWTDYAEDWKLKLALELDHAGFDIDLNKLKRR